MIDFYNRFEKRLDRTNLCLVIAAGLLMLLFHSTIGAASVILGGSISHLNFHWLKSAINYLIMESEKRSIGWITALQYGGRYALIGLALYVTIRFTSLDVTLVLAGLCSCVLAVILEIVFEIGKSLLRIDQNGRA